MSSDKREFDILVFGGTGFTGSRVVRLLEAMNLTIPWAVGVRNVSAAPKLFKDPNSKVGVVYGDVTKPDSLVAMAARARVVLNCVGPFRFFGEPVVKACIDANTHYLDVTGEPEFMERIEAKFGQIAKEKKLIIVSACGFDSIPCDLGVLFTIAQFPENSIPSSIESYLSCDAQGEQVKGHYATFESAVHGFGSAKALANIRKSRTRVHLPLVGKKLPKRGMAFFSKDTNKYSIPFMGADASVVRRTQEFYASETDVKSTPWKPVQFGAYVALSSVVWLVIMMIIGVVFKLMTSFAFGRKVLLANPKIFTLGSFSHEGPSEELMNKTSFDITFYASGYSSLEAAQSAKKPDVKLVTRVAGPEPGYIATPIFIVQAALTLLASEPSMPKGVLTPGAAFGRTELIKNLNNAGVSFKVVA